MEPCLSGFGNKFTPIIISIIIFFLNVHKAPNNSSDSDILEYKIIVEGSKSTHYSLSILKKHFFIINFLVAETIKNN